MRPAPPPESRRGRAAAALVLAIGLAAADAPPPRAQVLLSAPGQTRETLRGAVRGPNPARYLVAAAPGEALDVRLTAANPSVYFTLRTPGGAVLLYDSSDQDAAQRFSRRVAPGGQYRLEVRLTDAAARRKTVANYTLSVARGTNVIPTR